MLLPPALELRDGDADELDRLLRSTTARAGLARRARIVMLAADGMANTRISEVVGVSVPTVLTWRSRYLQDGLDGLLDVPRSGRPRHVDHADGACQDVCVRT
ncbi:helix-turn-helix domain-containing protein [Gordonia paraffinivorans]|uniref:helix-turn-helix domain-containing protein n=1 Tax=Gordonia paraffinivorans TaxID=175628 RepID=UPI003558AC9B